MSNHNKLGLVYRNSLRDYVTWSAWFVGILFLIYIVTNAFSIAINDSISWTFIEGGLSSATIFMLITGILSMGGFLTHYVSHGITRRDYFYGTMLAGFSAAFVMTVIVSLWNLLLNSAISWLNLEQNLTTRIIDGGLSTVDGSFSIIKLFLLLNLFFFLGWFISAGFNRHWTLGVVLVIASVFVVIVEAHLMTTLLATSVFVVASTAVVILLLRKMTKRIEVKP